MIILEELELKTGKRYDASYAWIVGLGSSISGIIVNAVAPHILYGNPIGYVAWQEGVTYTLNTKLTMLAFYTIFHGICMLLAGLPFIFYTLTGEKKKHIHEQVLLNRAAMVYANNETENVDEEQIEEEIMLSEGDVFEENESTENKE